MTTSTESGQAEPLTYASAPSHIVDGVEYVDDDAVLELGRKLAAERAELLNRLAQ